MYRRDRISNVWVKYDFKTNESFKKMEKNLTENQLYSLALKNSENIRNFIRKYVCYIKTENKTYILKKDYVQEGGFIRCKNFEGKNVVYERETLKNIWLEGDADELESTFGEGYLRKILTNLIEEVDGFIQACLLFNTFLPGKEGEIENFKREAIHTEKDNNYIRVTDRSGVYWDLPGEEKFGTFPLPSNLKSFYNNTKNIITVTYFGHKNVLYPGQILTVEENNNGDCAIM